jgi:hypothetical protein
LYLSQPHVTTLSSGRSTSCRVTSNLIVQKRE